ncbi:MAG: S1C family serine protease [Candidatus Polarisedimenticolia bacterium]
MSSAPIAAAVLLMILAGRAAGDTTGALPAGARSPGAGMPPAPAAAPAPADPGVYCTTCGARNRGGSRFCMKDGTALPAIDPSRYVRGRERIAETLSPEEIQRNIQAATRAVVRIHVKTTATLKIPAVQNESGEGFEFYRPGVSWRVLVGYLETAEESRFAGSGFVINPSGEVVTNAHVASPFGLRGPITVETRDGRSLPARLVGIDEASDLALLHVPGLGQERVEWGDSDRLRLGEVAWAIGNPADIGISMTRGTVASPARMRAGLNQVESYVHSDAHITGGNSGGPMINAFGQVIGVNAMTAGAAKGQGYSIASAMAQRVIDRLRAHGRYDRGFLGVQVAQVDATIIRQHALKVRTGLFVEAVGEDSPAARAGLRRGDVLYGINGRMATSAYLFQEAVSSVGPGVSLVIAVNRDGQAIEVPVSTVARRDAPRIDPVAELESQMFLRFEDDPKAKGVVVRVASNFSPFPKHGFVEGSIIESVVPAQDWTETPLTFDYYKKKARPTRIANLTDLRQALRRAYLGGRLAVTFEMRRTKDPVLAVALDATWPIVI